MPFGNITQAVVRDGVRQVALTQETIKAEIEVIKNTTREMNIAISEIREELRKLRKEK